MVGFDRIRMLISLLLWLLFLVNVNLFPGVPAAPVPALILSPYSIEFIIGALAALCLTSGFVQRLPRGVYIALIILIPVLLPFLFTHYYSPNGAAGNLFRQTVVFGAVYGILVIAMVSLEQRSVLSFHPFLVRMGDISYTIYLSHLLILGAIGRIWALYFQHPGSPRDELVIFPCMLTVIILYAHIANRLIEIPSYRFFIHLFKNKGYSDKPHPR
jgi:peptidoglycan/LPS O-acetylase OafA/YrhL